MEHPILIVSMTTWPMRIHTAIQALLTIVKSRRLSVYKEFIQIKLILAEDEYQSIDQLPDLYIQLYELGDIDIIFDKGNMKAFKKILPVAEKYNDKHILVVDDDRIYSKSFLTTFYSDMLLYPNDILVGRATHYLIPKDGKIISEPIRGILHEVPYRVLSYEKFASGLNGTLFPPHTFTDERFFDRDLIKKICEISDEDWCWLFCVLGKKVMRYSSHTDRIPLQIKCSGALHVRYGQKVYDTYYDNFVEYFPEVYDLLVERYKNKQEIKYIIKY